MTFLVLVWVGVEEKKKKKLEEELALSKIHNSTNLIKHLMSKLSMMQTGERTYCLECSIYGQFYNHFLNQQQSMFS